MDALIKLIARLIYVDRIYLLGYSSNAALHDGIFKRDQRSQHFELLVITQLSCNIDALNVQRIINQHEGINASVTLLVHSKESVVEALKENNRFFNEILRSDKLIYRQEGLPIDMELPDYDRSKEFSDAKLFWYHRQQRAEAIIAAASNITEEETSVVEAWLLNQVMEQICLGFIFVSIGYRPNQACLDHLFDICRCINPAIDEVFPTARKDDRAVFNTLTAAAIDMRHRDAIAIHPTDIGLLHRRCSSWMEKAEELIGPQLERLASFQQKPIL